MSQQQRNQDATIYVGNLDERTNEPLLWELFVQAGPVVNVFIPKDRISQQHQGFGFVEFMSEEDADYACRIMNSIKLFGKPLRVNKSAADKKNLDVGATLFISNLAPEVDEQMLQDTFAAFGALISTPKIGREPDTGMPRGFGFVSYDNFESSDAAVEAMNGQWLANRQIQVSYAFKKDGKGERHGSAAERLLASQARKVQQQRQQQSMAAMAALGQAAPTPTLTPGVPPLAAGYRPPAPPV